jgi:hypothetical protein
MGSKESSIAAALDDSKSENPLVVIERSCQVGYLESHRPKPRFGGQAISLRLHTI